MELYSTANVIRSILATVAPYFIFIALYAVIGKIGGWLEW